MIMPIVHVFKSKPTMLLLRVGYSRSADGTVILANVDIDQRIGAVITRCLPNANVNLAFGKPTLNAQQA